MSSAVRPVVHGAVIFDTSRGPLTMHLFGHDAPQNVRNFIGLCGAKFYNGAVVDYIVKDNYIEVRNRELRDGVDVCFDGLVGSDPSRRIEGEVALVSSGPIVPPQTATPPRSTMVGKRVGAVHAYAIDRRGIVLMVPNQSPDGIGSRFIITTSNRNLTDRLKQYTVIGEVVNAEGLKFLERANRVALRPRQGADRDTALHEGTPLRMIRIKHCIVLDNPFKAEQAQKLASVDLPKLYNTLGVGQYVEPFARGESPLYRPAVPEGFLSSDDEFDPAAHANEDNEEQFQELKRREQQARVDNTRALMLQVMDQIPDVDLKPPENVLFVCKLNPLTADEDLALCFRQFGKVTACDVIRDRKTGASLRYAFVEFEKVEAAERAFLKMDKVLIDDARIHVDFCQSVAKVWVQHRQQQKAAAAQRVGEKRVRE